MENFGLKGQKVIAIYRSNSEDSWALLKTDKSIFELRLGGLKQTNEVRSEEYKMDFPVKNKTIKSVKTGDFAVYIELENGECIEHSDTWISGDGEIDFAVYLLTQREYEEIKSEDAESNELRDIL